MRERGPPQVHRAQVLSNCIQLVPTSCKASIQLYLAQGFSCSDKRQIGIRSLLTLRVNYGSYNPIYSFYCLIPGRNWK